MLSIRSRTFESDDSADAAISKLDWKVEKVKRLTNPLLNNSTTDTVRPWVGKVNRDKREFEITQTAPYFSPRILEGNFFQLFVRGQIIDEGGKSKIILKFRLGLIATMFFLLMFMYPILGAFIYSELDNEADWTGLLLGLVVPIFSALLLAIQLNRTENKLIDLFEV